MSTPEALAKRRKYMREYTRRRYREDPDYRERAKASSKKSRAKKKAAGWVLDSKINVKEIYGRLIDNCQACNVRRRKRPNGRSNIHFHHLSKEAYGNETAQNTAILCFKCHLVADKLKYYFGFIEKNKLLKIISEIRSTEPIRNIREQASKLL